MANREDIEFHAGDDKRLELTVYDEDGAVVNLTGLQAAKWSLAKTVNSSVLASHSLDDGNITVINAVNGRLNIVIDAADTAGLKGVHYHEAEVTDADGKVGTIIYGTVNILASLNDPA